MQKIIIRNFRQITHAEIEIKNLLVLVGEQASGKSTITKLIYFFKSLKEDFYELFNDVENIDDGNIEGFLLNSIGKKFSVYFGTIEDLEDNFEVIYYYGNNGENKSDNNYIKLSKNKKLSIAFNQQVYKILIEFIKMHNESKSIHNHLKIKLDEVGYKLFKNDIIEYNKNMIKFLNTIFNDNYSNKFLPAGRNITVSFPEQFQASFLSALSARNIAPNSIDLVLMKEFILHSKYLYDYFRGKTIATMMKGNGNEKIGENALDFFLKHTEYILQGKYNNADGNEKIVFGNQRKDISLNNASSGQQEVVRIIQDLLQILLENQSSCRIIEEPEAHLYPKAQKNLLELMALIINKTNSQIIITTHSPYILSILNNLLMYSVVAENNPAALQQIQTHFGTRNMNAKDNEKINLDSTQVQAYALTLNGENYCTSIIDAETGLIGDNYLDAVTEDLNEDFNTLYHLNFQKQ